MEKVLKPSHLDLEPTAPEAPQIYQFWKRQLENLVNSCFSAATNEEKLPILTQFLTHRTYPFIEEATTYSRAIALLDDQYAKKKNELYARHLLNSRRQQPEENVDQYLAALKQLSKDGNYTAVTKTEHQDQAVRDSFINGMKSGGIRTRILEEAGTLTLQQVWEKARGLETAQKNAESYSLPPIYSASVTPSHYETQSKISSENYDSGNPPGKVDSHMYPQSAAAFSPRQEKCYNCGRDRHENMMKCPARDETCYRCKRKGHYGRCCRSRGPPKRATNASLVYYDSNEKQYPVLALTTSSHILKKSITRMEVNGILTDGLVDSGSSHSYMSESYQRRRKFRLFPTSSEVSMASTTHSMKIKNYCIVDITLNNQLYQSVKLMILPESVANVILGLDFQELHKKVTFHHEKGYLPPLNVCGSVTESFPTLKTEPPELFANLIPGWHPVREKSRRYSLEDREFIAKEVVRLESLGVIERSNSPWRAQVLVHRERNKTRLVVDYSTTVNKFTQLDAYPVPNMDELVNKIAHYNVHSTIDMTSAYHQLIIKNADRPFTAFEANGRLYQFTRLPFGVTNGVAIFQRKMDDLVEANNLQATFPYLDNITISGRNQEEHDYNLQRFMKAAEEQNLKFNKSKCTFSTRKLTILGKVVEEGEIRPDPDRLKALKELPVPQNMKALKRIQGFFSYYSSWIENFSHKIKPLIQVTAFPMSEEAVTAFYELKKEVEDSVVGVIDESQPFLLETDASDYAIAATLNQGGRPVAFFSRTLHGSELRASAIEKEA